MLLLTATVHAAAPLYIDVDINYQQTAQLRDIELQQGGSAGVRIRPRLDHDYITVSDYSARVEVRETPTTNVYMFSASTSTNEAGHYLECPLDSGETGTAVTNWTYA